MAIITIMQEDGHITPIIMSTVPNLVVYEMFMMIERPALVRRTDKRMRSW